jgi:transaldolase/glucose-6-phosphate isomerase
MSGLRASLGSSARLVEDATLAFERSDGVRRLWDADPTLWTGGSEARWLGWLGLPAGGGALDLALVGRLREHLAHESIRHVAVLGMGGSSLCPDVLAHTFGAEASARGFPRLHVFDSTVAAQVRSGVARLDLAHTLFVVSSKSGSTIEPNVLFSYFEKELEGEVAQRIGRARAGSRFAAITDPGSALERVAREKRFAAIAYGIPEIGGRFSALSPFGLLPGALMGLDTNDFLARARTMADACGRDVPPRENPGVQLGLVMGALARAGRDKLTFVISPAIARLGAWLEQLIAESTGKHGRGIVALGDERVATPERYGDDRLFVYVRLASAPSLETAEQDAAIAALEAAGHPCVRLDVADVRDLGAELFRFEIATAVAGAVLEIDPFDQPDVESAKLAARALMDAYEAKGSLPPQTPVLEEDGIALFADPALPAPASLRDALARHEARLAPGDYFAINAYLDGLGPDPAATAPYEDALQAIRHAVRDRHRTASALGYGPRFLHSTGQLHKGGPNRGVFLQLTADDPAPLPIPGQRYSFDVLARAQAQGDFEVLVARGRRALWLHLSDPRAGLERLRDWLA